MHNIVIVIHSKDVGLRIKEFFIEKGWKAECLEQWSE